MAIDTEALARLADWLAVGVAISLPWSTSATGILIALWLLAVLPTMQPDLLFREGKSAAGGLPLLLWLLAAVGMLWADVSWWERFAGLDGYHRLLAIPLLLAQFRRSELGLVVLVCFVASATCLLALSWALVLIPAFAGHGNSYGVPVKDYIFQGGEFLLCAMALIGAAFDVWRQHRYRLALALGGLAAGFLANIAFVAGGRTMLLVAPFLVLMLGWRQAGVKGVAAACLIAGVTAGALWLASPFLRAMTLRSVTEFQVYLASDTPNSTGQHLAFLREAFGFVETAPVVGHGTGSIAEEYRHAAAGKSGASGFATVNPHNQVFAVAIQLGLVGAAVLLAMWIAHLMLFCGNSLVAWVGAIVVVDNIVSSLFNSHLFDFGQGWLYVFGVGVAGGTVLRARKSAPAAAALPSSAKS